MPLYRNLESKFRTQENIQRAKLASTLCQILCRHMSLAHSQTTKTSMISHPTLSNQHNHVPYYMLSGLPHLHTSIHIKIYSVILKIWYLPIMLILIKTNLFLKLFCATIEVKHFFSFFFFHFKQRSSRFMFLRQDNNPNNSKRNNFK